MAKRGPRPKFTTAARDAQAPTAEVSMALHPKQKLFVDSNKIYRGFVSGVGGGKSIAGAYDFCIKSRPGCLYAIVGPNYRMLADATMRAFREVATKLGLWDEGKYRKTDNIAILNNEAEVLFRSGDHPDTLRGPTLSGCWMDECQGTDEAVFNAMIGRLREGGIQGWLCLGGEEEIFDPACGQSRRIDAIREDFHVFAMDQSTGRRVTALATKPFRKCIAPLYRFHLSNGESFVAALDHKVLVYADRVSLRDRQQETDSNQRDKQSAYMTTQTPHTTDANHRSCVWLRLRQCVANLPQYGTRACPGDDLDNSEDRVHTKCASVPLASLSCDPLYIASYEYVRTDWVYDLTVPLYSNYEHCQALHHNSGTFTPAGKDHWTYRVFGDETNPNVTLVHCSTKDNPFNPPEYYENLLLQYGKGEGGMLRARQELEGEFVCVEGAEWGPEYFSGNIWFTDWPTDSENIRIAALDSSKGIGGKTGDYSCFIKAMYSGGLLWIEADMDNRRNTDVMASTCIEIQKTFRPDCFGIEEEFGGKVMKDNLIQRQQAANVAMKIGLIPTQGIAKEVRIRRLGRFISSHWLRFRDTPGTRLLMQQLESFPHAAHDDGPDALEMAVRIAVEGGLFGGEVY